MPDAPMPLGAARNVRLFVDGTTVPGVSKARSRKNLPFKGISTIFLVSISWTLITVKILENITELSLGPAAAFSVLVVAIVFAMIAIIGRVLRLFRAPGAMPMTSLLGG